MSFPQQRLYFRRLQLNDDKLRWLWEQIVRLQHRTMHDGATPETLMVTLAATDALHFEVIDLVTQQIIGIASLRDITPWSASAHATYFDGRLRGRESATRAMLAAMMQQLDLQVIHCFPPASHRATVAWVQRMGFTETGIVPRAIRRGGVCIDHVVLSLLREETELPVAVDAGGNGAAQNGKPRRRRRRENGAREAESNALAGSTGYPTHPDAVCHELAGPGPSRLRRLLASWWARATVSTNGDGPTRSGDVRVGQSTADRL